MQQLVGILLQSTSQETAAIINSACDERMNKFSNRVVVKRTSDAT